MMVELLIQGMTWEKFFVALFILFMGMFARGLWWWIKRQWARYVTRGLDWGNDKPMIDLPD